MKKSTLIGFFVGLLALSVNAQVTQPSNSTTLNGTTKTEVQQKSSSSIQDLLVRYNDLGKYSGDVSDHFTKEEQRMLRMHFVAQRPERGANVLKDISLRNSSDAKHTLASPEEVAAQKQRHIPLFELRAADGNSSTNVMLPAAYFNNSATTIAENAGVANNGKRNTNVTIPYTGTYYSSMAPNALLYDNGPYFNVAGSPDLSVLESATLGMDTYGPGAQFSAGNSVADDVVFADDVDIETIDVFAYQTGATAPSITAVYLQVWDADPSGSGASIVWGDLTTNILDVANYSGANRVLETDQSATNRQINRVTALTTGLTLTAGTYWIEYTFAGSGSSGPWAPPIVILGETTTGNALQNQNGTWIALEDGGTLTPQGLPFVIYGDVVGGGGGPFPDPYCGPLAFNTIEPISLVDVAGISNVSDAAIGGSPAHEDFIVVEGDMEEGMTYPIALEGNTNGGFTCSFTVFIDWNQDGVLDNASERYEIGTINNSTGTDGQQATNDIVVPAGVVAGPTRMRVIKKFGSTYSVDSCTGTSYGQAEDYTINVTTGGGGTGGPCATTAPSNAFENGKSFTKNLGRIVANDLTVVAGEDMLLETITFTAFVGTTGSGVNTDNVDLFIYEDDGSGAPGALYGTAQTSLVPTSQVVIGGNFGYDAWSIELDIADVNLVGQTGADTRYWIGLSLDATDLSNTFWEYSTAGGVGLGQAYDDGTGFIVEAANEGVYSFDGTCTPMGGGGPGPLTTVYGINNDDLSLIGFGVNTPENTEVFGTSPVTVNFENAGAIDPANPTTGYVLDSDGDFYSFDVTTGVYTALGSIPGIDWTGMEYDRASGVLYAINTTELYTIDPVAVTSTLVGPLGLSANALPIALAIDGAGVGYTYDLDDDNLYSIDLATGATTQIGYIGFTANFGQGMCYDPTTDMVYMAAFNGDAFAAEWRSVDTATGNTTLIGPILVEDSDPQVGWASVGETLPPPACPEPTDLTVSNIEPTTVDLNWVAEPNASSGYIWYVFETGADPITATPVATGTTAAGTTTATATGLSSGLSYDFYVVADCASDGLSKLAGPVTFATEVSCGGKFYDTGGPNANYENNANETTVISPEVPTDYVTVTFTAFDVEANWDALYVYDGPDASSPIISSGNPATNSGFPAGGYYGTTIPGPFSSTHPSGALTFVFRSEGSVNKAGWEADVLCTPTPPPNDMIVNSIDVDEVGFPYTDPAVNMPGATFENGNPAGCDLTGANGVWYNFVSEGDGQANATIMTPAGASSVTFYTAPDENAVETDLTLVPQNSNQCGPGTTSSIYTMAGQAYYVFVLNTGGITDIVIDGINLGVADNTIEGFSYYPNPTSDILNLQSIDTIENVSIYSLLGQRVIDTSINATTSKVDVSGLSTGTYVMKVTVNGQTATYKVLKQ